MSVFDSGKYRRRAFCPTRSDGVDGLSGRLVDASALPALAEQFHVQGLEGWLFTTDEREKRELIKQAIELHKYKGTIWAVRRVLEILSLRNYFRMV